MLLAIQSFDNLAAILAAEKAEFGMDHCEAGALLAEAWRFPEELQGVMARHQNRPDRTLDVVSLIQTSCRLAAGYDFAIAHGEYQRTAHILDGYVPYLIRPAVEKPLRVSKNGLLAAMSRWISTIILRRDGIAPALLAERSEQHVPQGA